MALSDSFDVAVVGAGVFGSSIAYRLQRSGRRVVLLDRHGPASFYASSGDDSRIIRMGYGADDLYTRWAVRSLELWKEFSQETGRQVFFPTGVLWLAGRDDAYTPTCHRTLARLNVAHERLSVSELKRRFPWLRLADVRWGLLETEAGVLAARRAVEALVQETIRLGGEYRLATVAPPPTSGRLDFLTITDGGRIRAERFVFACGSWLSKMFPRLLGRRIFPTRQELFYFDPLPEELRSAVQRVPAWIHHSDLVYAVPDAAHQGMKVALDRHGARFDPEKGSRRATHAGLSRLRRYLAGRVPALASAALLRSHVCHYENTSTGDFVIDRYPGLDNVWIAGGGSGHGFKHGPAVGEYVLALITRGGPVEPRFSLATKGTVKRRKVY